MWKYDARCKYCGAKLTGGTMCGGCREKLQLIRKLLGMVKNAKAKVEREKRIKEDLEKVRKDG